jgi:trimethylamine---corrinoid protein Co-methyltransferase
MKGRRPPLGNPIWVIPEEDLERIHRATVEVLETVGVAFESEKALRILGQAGAKVEGSVVKFPESMIEKAIGLTPQHVTYKAKKPEYNVELGRGKVHYTNAFGATFIKDLYSGEYRKATLKDLEDFVRLADYLPNVHFVLTQCLPQDVPENMRELLGAYTMLANTWKNIHPNVETAEFLDPVIEMAEIAAAECPDGPIFSSGTVSVTPLKYTQWSADRIIKIAAHEIPCLVVCGAEAGATSPVTLAGTLVVQNAEVIAGIILGQIVKPGCPMVYGTFAGPMDMSNGKFLLAAPELSLMNVATQQLVEWYYKMPFGYGTGGIGDSGRSDAQAQMEKALTTLYAAIGGVDVIHDACSGLLGSGMVTSHEQLVMDNEMCNVINRLLDGFQVNDLTLALDVIRQVGPGGEFISSDHTLKNFKKEYYISRLFNRSEPYGEEGNEPDFVENSRERAKEILETHHPKPLSDEALAKMRAVIKRYE